ncbi:MAG: DUF523 domain-containing protein [Desulfuromonas sp.]|nr:MAG: DUF523 domain-containing protein [Desulfuromonas sp.]
MARHILVSACLLGLNTRYDGENSLCTELLDRLKQQDLIPVPICPEQLVGLPTPRPKAWFSDGDGQSLLSGSGQVINEEGQTMDDLFIKGAQMSLQIATLTGCTQAILKQKSPSCGSHMIYRNGTLVSGQGVTAALLDKHGIHIDSEESFGN